MFTQDAAWLEHALGLRTAPQVERQAYVVDDQHPVLDGLDHEDLSHWNGSATSTEAYPRFPGWEWTPSYGWRWGNRHAVSSAPIEKPHRGSWTPLVEQGFDLAYTPLMEMRHGEGLVILTTFDVEGRTREDPVAARLTERLMHYASTYKADQVPAALSYLGDESGIKRLREAGVIVDRVGRASEARGLLAVGPGFDDEDQLRDFARAGGRVIVLHREGDAMPMGVRLRRIDDFIGGQPDAWPSTRGLSPGDLRWRAPAPADVLSEQAGLDVTAAGQIGRMPIGGGVIVFAQIGPDTVPADKFGYLRYTRWRQTRALSQVMANLGAAFEQDRQFLDRLAEPGHYIPLAGTWDVAAVTTLDESPSREWNPAQPISDQAKRIIDANASADWIEATVPGYLEAYDDRWRWVDGEFVYRKTVHVPEHLAGRAGTLSLGRVDEVEASFVNGQKIGESQDWLAGRAHAIPEGLLRPGRNTLHVRVWDQGIHGGMVGDPAVLGLTLPAGPALNLYHPDYRATSITVDGGKADWSEDRKRWTIADDPYRYYRW